MAYKWVDETKLNAALTASADAIREKTGDTAQINFDMENETGFESAIEEIESGGMELVYSSEFVVDEDTVTTPAVDLVTISSGVDFDEVAETNSILVYLVRYLGDYQQLQNSAVVMGVRTAGFDQSLKYGWQSNQGYSLIKYSNDVNAATNRRAAGRSDRHMWISSPVNNGIINIKANYDSLAIFMPAGTWKLAIYKTGIEQGGGRNA